jgi:hypothetical protein
MYVLRVGKIAQGKRAPKCAAINEPPGMNDAMRIAKMRNCNHDRSKWKREENDNNIDDEEDVMMLTRTTM